MSAAETIRVKLENMQGGALSSPGAVEGSSVLYQILIWVMKALAVGKNGFVWIWGVIETTFPYVVEYNSEMTSFAMHITVLLVFLLPLAGLVLSPITRMNEFDRQSKLAHFIRSLPFVMLQVVIHCVPLNLLLSVPSSAYYDFLSSFRYMLKPLPFCLFVIPILALNWVVLTGLQHVIKEDYVFSYKKVFCLSILFHSLHFIERLVINQFGLLDLLQEVSMFIIVLCANIVTYTVIRTTIKNVIAEMEANAKKEDEDEDV